MFSSEQNWMHFFFLSVLLPWAHFSHFSLSPIFRGAPVSCRAPSGSPGRSRRVIQQLQHIPCLLVYTKKIAGERGGIKHIQRHSDTESRRKPSPLLRAEYNRAAGSFAPDLPRSLSFLRALNFQAKPRLAGCKDVTTSRHLFSFISQHLPSYPRGIRKKLITLSLCHIRLFFFYICAVLFFSPSFGWNEFIGSRGN